VIYLSLRQACWNDLPFRTRWSVPLRPASGGNPSDTARARAQLDRRQRVQVFPEQEIGVAAPEDVILGKLIYCREGDSDKHLRDIAGILKFAKIDRLYVARLATQFGVEDSWQHVLNAVD
jgi:hypothetical protein